MVASAIMVLAYSILPPPTAHISAWDERRDIGENVVTTKTLINTVTFKGKVGSYTFEIYPVNQKFNSVAAIYIFAKMTTDTTGVSRYLPIYIGQTDSLADRIPTHEKWLCARFNGANTICVLRDDSMQSRLYKETDLRAAWNTPCNDQ
jgi:hypothetical protein